MQVLYLTHDVNDAATWRRVDMLRLGQAQVTVAGFHRAPVRQHQSDTRVISLGQTHNGRFAQRMLAILHARLKVKTLLSKISAPDIVLARNLETLALAPYIRRIFPSSHSTVYECLDIHRLQLGTSPTARLLRAYERGLLRSTDLILTSSPGFVRNYFASVQQTKTPIRVIENKCFPVPETKAGPKEKISIGWFGILRCRQSLAMLDTLTRAHAGTYRVVLRGRPALDAIPEFHDTVERNPDLIFHGAYQPDELSSIYSQVHFSWLIDRYEAGANSEWLLPNRLYEGCRYGAIPIALEGSETARFLKQKNLGMTLQEPTSKALEQALAGTSHEDLTTLRDTVRAAPKSLWSVTEDDCVALVKALSNKQVQPGQSVQLEALP